MKTFPSHFQVHHKGLKEMGLILYDPGLGIFVPVSITFAQITKAVHPAKTQMLELSDQSELVENQ
jgi:hypothetical protein